MCTEYLMIFCMMVVLHPAKIVTFVLGWELDSSLSFPNATSTDRRSVMVRPVATRHSRGACVQGGAPSVKIERAEARGLAGFTEFLGAVRTSWRLWRLVHEQEEVWTESGSDGREQDG